MVIHLDDYRRSPRRLLRHEIAMIERNDPHLASIPHRQVLGALINQLQHEASVTLRPLRVATIIPLKQEQAIMPSGTPSKFNRALRLARKLRPSLAGRSWEQVRDLLDLSTDGELDGWQLDKVTDEALKQE